jgi:hypothetical protein
MPKRPHQTIVVAYVATAAAFALLLAAVVLPNMAKAWFLRDVKLTMRRMRELQMIISSHERNHQIAPTESELFTLAGHAAQQDAWDHPITYRVYPEAPHVALASAGPDGHFAPTTLALLAEEGPSSTASQAVHDANFMRFDAPPTVSSDDLVIVDGPFIAYPEEDAISYAPYFRLSRTARLVQRLCVILGALLIVAVAVSWKLAGRP